MKELLEKIRDLKNSEIKNVVNQRIKEFEKTGRESSEEIFKELCFCLLTANFQAEKSIKIQEKIGKGFLDFSEKELINNLKRLGHRFPNKRAEYILEARKFSRELKKILENFKSEKEMREWLVKNMRGLGYKESSHFLRNIGFKNVAIIDFHVLDLLRKYNLIEKPKNLSKKNYIEIENLLKKIAENSGTNLAELDLYLWHMETGKILK